VSIGATSQLEAVPLGKQGTSTCGPCPDNTPNLAGQHQLLGPSRPVAPQQQSSILAMCQHTTRRSPSHAAQPWCPL